MKEEDYQRFKATFESAHDRQKATPLAGLLTSGPDYSRIRECLNQWETYRQSDEALIGRVRQWLRDEVDAETIENREQIPPAYLQALRTLGCLSARIPKSYGGLGLGQCAYSRLLEIISSRSEVLALVVSVQQLGVAQGLLSEKKLHPDSIEGEKLRRKYLHRLAETDIGAFCLTTPETGSDPSRLQTVARSSSDGSYFELSGSWDRGGKLYTTLGTVADVFMMLAVVVFPGEEISTLEPRWRITAFLVERDTPGIEIRPLAFCGWHGLPNAAIRLDKVRVSASQQVGEIGEGLKISFMNLGSGRINISAISLGMLKQLTHTARWWGVRRVQGGKPVGEHSLNTEQLVDMHCRTYAAESFLRFVSGCSDRGGTDIRLEAAMLKLFCSHSLMKVADETLQLRGGRGYETHASQASRGETAVPIERLFRSARMLKIGEGGSNILRLYLMRCLLDSSLRDLTLLSQHRTASVLFRLGLQYGRWYFLPSPGCSLSLPASLKTHMSFIHRGKQRLFRLLMNRMMAETLRYCFLRIGNRLTGKPGQLPTPTQSLEQRQLLIGDCAEIALLLSVMAITCIRAADSDKKAEIELASEFCVRAEIEVAHLVRKIRQRGIAREKQIDSLGSKIMNGHYADILEGDTLPWDLPEEKV